MPRQPVVSGRELLTALEKLGYELIRRRGSHAVMVSRRERKKISVPCHGNRPLPTGTLAALLREIGLTAEQLRDLLD